MRWISRVSIGAVAAASLFLASGSAFAQSEQALVTLTYKVQFFGGVTYINNSDDKWATVQTGTPTPSVMWPANLVSAFTTRTGSNSNTPFFSTMSGYRNLPGAIGKSFAGAAPTGGSNVPLPGAGTTKCFASIAPAAPGTPALPGQCFPRVGGAERDPGSRRFGGTARMLRVSDAVGTTVAQTGLNIATGMIFFTPDLTGPAFVGNYGIRGSNMAFNTVLGSEMQTMQFFTTAPATTGMVRITGPDFGTMITATGSHSFNTANLTGMISLVQPQIHHQFSRIPPPVNLFSAREGQFNRLATVELTFLPEPASGAMLALGGGALLVLGRRRRPKTL